MKALIFILIILANLNVFAQDHLMTKLDSMLVNGELGLKDPYLDEDSKLMLNFLNDIRTNYGREKLVIDSIMLYSQQIHVKMMMAEDTLTHYFNTKLNRTLYDRYYSALHRKDGLKYKECSMNFVFDTAHHFFNQERENCSKVSCIRKRKNINDRIAIRLMPLLTQFTSNGHSKALTIEGNRVGLFSETKHSKTYFSIVISQESNSEGLGLPLNGKLRSEMSKFAENLQYKVHHYIELSLNDFKGFEYLIKYFDLAELKRNTK